MSLHRWYSIVTLMFAALLLVISSGGRVAFTPDSIYYWSAARSLRAGEGLRTGVFYAEALQRRGTTRAAAPAEPGEERGALQPSHPLCAWPPGYAAALAVMPAADIARGGWLLNLGALLVIAALLRRLGQALAPGWDGGGALAALLLVGLPVLQGSARRLWSEPLFCALLLAGLWAVLHGRSLLVALIAAAATYIRFTGLTLFLTWLLELVLQALRRRSARGLLRAAPALVAYPLLMLPLLHYNLSRCGQLGGVPRLPSDRGLLRNGLDATRALLEFFPLWRAVLPGPVDSLISAALLGALALSVGRAARRAPPLPDRRPPAAGVLGRFSLVYLGTLLLLRSRTLFDPLNFRLLLPVLLCGGLLLTTALLLRLRRWAALLPACLAWIALCAAATLGDGLRNGDAGSLAQAPGSAQRLLGGADPAVLLFADQPFVMHLALARPIHWLPALEHLPRLRAAHPLRLLIQQGSPFFRGAEEQARYEEALRALGARVTAEGALRLYCLSGGAAASPWPC